MRGTAVVDLRGAAAEEVLRRGTHTNGTKLSPSSPRKRGSGDGKTLIVIRFPLARE